MSLSKEELVLTACFHKSTDMSISIEDALGDAKQIDTSLPVSFDPAYSRLLAKAACILLSSNCQSPGDAIAEAQKVIMLAEL